MQLERLSLSEWTDVLPNSGFEPFHSSAALAVVDDYTDGDLLLFAGFKGDRPVALLPVWRQNRAVGRVLMSPPPGMGISRLGPILDPASPKQSKYEKLNRTFTDQIVDAIDATATSSLFRMTCNTAYTDPRPYEWAGFDIETFWTYRLDVADTSPDDLLQAASKSLRREITDARELDISVQQEGLDGARAVFDETRRRYAEQGRPFSLSWSYVSDLVESMLSDDRARVYTARTPEGKFLTGITVLYSNDAAYYWQGGTRSTHDGVAVNSHVHWCILKDIADDPPRESVTLYDLQGANTERLCRYKSKFGTELTPYYTIETGGVRLKAAKKAYQLVAR